MIIGRLWLYNDVIVIQENKEGAAPSAPPEFPNILFWVNPSPGFMYIYIPARAYAYAYVCVCAVHMYVCVCVCKDSAAPAHARSRAHRPAAPRQGRLRARVCRAAGATGYVHTYIYLYITAYT